MKINLRYILVLAGTIILAACSDLLDLKPEESLTRNNMYTDDKDAYSIKSGLYNTMQGLVEERFILGELRGDLVASARGAVGNKNILEFTDHYVTPDNKYLDWSGFYKLINQCNDALVSLNKIYKTDKTLEPIVFNHIVGEVLWMRAWAYFTLVSNWGDVPFYTMPVYDVSDVSALSPTDENVILDQLEKDLLWASKNVFINWAWGNGTRIDKMWNHETVNQCAVIGLLGDVLMYRDKYAEAWNQTVYLKILTEQPSNSSIPGMENWHNSFNINGTSLNGGKDWFNVEFRYANESYNSSWYEQGLVLAFNTESTYSGGGEYNEFHPLGFYTSNVSSNGGRYLVKPSNSAVVSWKMARDLNRGEGYSYYIDANTDTLIWKYCGLTPQGTQRDLYRICGNINIIRTSDLYLKAAEAANRLGMPSLAIEILNQNRSRIGLPFAGVQTNATTEEIEDAIMDERALELAFEGVRWYDLVRIAKRRNNPNYLIDKIVANAPDSEKEALRARLELQSLEDWKLPYGSLAKSLNPNL